MPKTSKVRIDWYSLILGLLQGEHANDVDKLGSIGTVLDTELELAGGGKKETLRRWGAINKVFDEFPFTAEENDLKFLQNRIRLMQAYYPISALESAINLLRQNKPLPKFESQPTEPLAHEFNYRYALLAALGCYLAYNILLYLPGSGNKEKEGDSTNHGCVRYKGQELTNVVRIIDTHDGFLRIECADNMVYFASKTDVESSQDVSILDVRTLVPNPE